MDFVLGMFFGIGLGSLAMYFGRDWVKAKVAALVDKFDDWVD